MNRLKLGSVFIFIEVTNNNKFYLLSLSREEIIVFTSQMSYKWLDPRIRKGTTKV